MAKFQFKAPYNLSMEDIREKVEKGAKQFGADVKWKNGNECHFSGQYKGVSASGIFTVHEREVEVLLNLPMMAMPFKSKIKERVI